MEALKRLYQPIWGPITITNQYGGPKNDYTNQNGGPITIIPTNMEVL